MITEGEYFSEEAIKQRQPIIYHIYLGRYLRAGADTPNSFYELLLNQALSNQTTEEIEFMKDKYPDLAKHLEYSDTLLSEEEQSENEDELIVLMHQKFLAGEDTKYINYEEVDNNE